MGLTSQQQLGHMEMGRQSKVLSKRPVTDLVIPVLVVQDITHYTTAAYMTRLVYCQSIPLIVQKEVKHFSVQKDYFTGNNHVAPSSGRDIFCSKILNYYASGS